MAKVSNGLTGKQRAFVLEYAKDFNATQAAIRAGYSQKTAYATGWENLRKPEIQSAVEAEFRRRSVSVDEIVARLFEQATANVGDFIVVNPDGDRIAFSPEMLKEHGRLVKRVRAKTTVKFDSKGDQIEYTTLELELYDAQKALEILGKHLGMISGRLEVSWRDEMTEAIKRGEISWHIAADTLGRDLAAELFERAGVPVTAARPDADGD